LTTAAFGSVLGATLALPLGKHANAVALISGLEVSGLDNQGEESGDEWKEL